MIEETAGLNPSPEEEERGILSDSGSRQQKETPENCLSKHGQGNAKMRNQ